MNLRAYLKSTFGKDLFTHLKKDDILEERIRIEKKIEQISRDIKNIQEKIRQLMLDAKGQPRAYKFLNIQKIKALRLESATKAQEAESYIKQLQVLLLLEAMREHQKSKEKSEFMEKLLNTDIEHLSEMIFTEDVKRAIEEGKLDEVKEKLRDIFAKEEMPVDAESQELLKTIEDLEKVDEETALRLAEEKAKTMAEVPLRKKELELEE
ncbi:MAG: hypothetical protein DRP12_02620 [Candidatus Aenigmatarchaeota archaeon]|nr:MAG: hypothetical protein DRP12_02620 [Candidatus Aenigmarchaeota archaeon]